ncbi:MAG: ArsR/SmtB family transcription factor [Thermoplasmata archaeon]
MVENNELDDILQVLGNSIRRKIIQRLSEGKAYPLQLAKDLRVSQQSISKHLKILEKYKIVKSYTEESKSGGPKRKYYYIAKTMSISINISSNVFSVVHIPNSIEKVENNEYKEAIAKISKESNNIEKLKILRTLSNYLDKEYSNVANKQRELLSLKDKVNSLIESIIEKECGIDTLEYRIAWHIIEDRDTSLSRISEILDLREKEIEDIWKRYIKKIFG